MFVKSDHAGNMQTRRSRTRIMIGMNEPSIHWYSKKQFTIETSAFVAEFIAIKVGVGTLHAMQYKLRMMGIPISGEDDTYLNFWAQIYLWQLHVSDL